jgi:hypothetical protein
MAKNTDKNDEQGKAKGKDKKSKGKSAQPAAGTGAGASGLTLAAHPRAVRRVAEAKAWGGLGGFLLGGYLSLPTHSALEAALRALAAGVVCYVVVWAAAVFLWKRLLVAELRHAEHELIAAHLAKLEAAEEASAAAAGAPRARGRASAISR